MGTRYLKKRILVGLSLEEDQYNKFKSIVGSNNASETVRTFIDDFVSQNDIDSRKDIDERFKLYHKLAKRYDHDMIKLFIKSLDNLHDLSRVINNSRLLAELARNRKKELTSETDDINDQMHRDRQWFASNINPEQCKDQYVEILDEKCVVKDNEY